MSKSKVDELSTFVLDDVEELEGLRLSPFEVQFIMNYLSPSCGYDSKKAYRMTLGEEEFKTISKGKFYGRLRALMSKEDVKTAISRFLTKDIAEKKQEIVPTLLNDLMLAANYDPAMIIDDDGDFLHGALTDIPQQLRRAVIEGVDIRYWGKESQVRTRKVLLADKSKARQQLLDIAKFLNNISDDGGGGNNFSVTINTQNIEGMATAEDLLKQSAMTVENIEEDE